MTSSSPTVPDFEELLALQYQVKAIPTLTHHTYKVNSPLAGLYTSAFCGQGMDFQEARVYQEGDDVRHIDWRITARTGIPYVRIFEEQRERSVLFCVDTSSQMAFGTRQIFKSVQAARAVALLGWSATQHQDRVGGLLFGHAHHPLRFFRPQKGGRTFFQLLKALALESTGHAEPDPLITALNKLNASIPTGALIFIVADFNRDPAALESSLSYLKQQHEVVLIAVDDPADWDLPAMGAVLFTDHRGQVREINTSSLSGHQRYRQLWQQQRQQLKTLLDRFNIPLISIVTHDNLYQTLTLELQHLIHRQVVR